MGRRAGSSLFLLLLLTCHVVAVLLFCKGFLLRRVVIPEYSNCTQQRHSTQHAQNEPSLGEFDGVPELGPSCNIYPRKFKRVVWLLVDALRYDFVEYDSTLDPVPVYRNKLPFIRDLLKERPQNARLYRFVADPPTTTMQRLKALTTGSLPTFIDIGSNFNSYKIMEDSLPYQASANRRNLTFIGDDTWLGLYEGMLTKVFEYPSLNVKDLHTVDNGVIEHMVPELEVGDAEFVIGHFLGVDHVGHTYGSTHWSMGEKLSQMNEVLKSILSAVDEESIVFVFGDHGMTVTGDHGGETELETTAALLVYTPTPIFPPIQHSGRRLYQIDIVPTVSLLLGMPIPFSNLGMIIPEVFLPWKTVGAGFEDSNRFSVEESDGYKGRVTREFLTALQINAEQLQRYLKTYVKHSEDFPSDVYVTLQTKLARAQKLHSSLKSSQNSSQAELTEVASAYVGYMREVKSMCHNVWAKFDDFHIAQGIILFALAVCMNVLSLFDPDLSLQCLPKCFPTACVLGAVVSLVSLVVSPLPLEVGLSNLLDMFLSLSFYPLLLFLLFHVSFLCYQIYQSFENSLTNVVLLGIDRLSFTYVFSIVVTVACSVTLLSNSFILYEGDMTIFLIQSMLICFSVQRLQQCLTIRPSLSQHSTTCSSDKEKIEMQKIGLKTPLSIVSILRTLWPLLLAMLLVRLTRLFHACRDLQVECEATSFIQPYHGAVETLGRLADARLFLSCLGVTCVPASLAVFVRRNKHSRRLSWSLSLCVYSALPLSSLLVCGFWFLQSLPQHTLDSLPHWQHVILPRAVYALCVCTVVVGIVAPFARRGNERLSGQRGHKQNGEKPSLTQNREDSLKSRDSDSEKLRRRMVIDSSVQEREKPDVVENEKLGSTPKNTVAQTPLLLVVAVILVALWLPTALVLNDGVALCAVLLALQLHLIVSALSQAEAPSWPAVVLWGLISSQFFFGFGHHATVVSLRFEAGFVGLHGDMSGLNLLLAGTLVGLNMLSSQILLGLGLPLLLTTIKTEKTTAPLAKRLFIIALQYIAFHSLKTLLTLVTASLQRRHLMVWGVFSPRFLYEAAFQTTTDVCILIAYLFTCSALSRDTAH